MKTYDICLLIEIEKNLKDQDLLCKHFLKSIVKDIISNINSKNNTYRI